MEQLSRLYGYAFLISGIDAVFIAGVSALPLTKWDGDGVPRADVVVTTAAIDIWAAGAASCLIAFNTASADPFPDPTRPYQCERYAWSGSFAGGVAGRAVSSGFFVYAPLALGANPRYYLLITATQLFGGPLATVCSVWLQRWQYARSANLNAEIQAAPEAAAAAPRQKQAEKGGFWATVAHVANGTLVPAVVLGYPLVVLPFYGAETTSEYVERTTCFLHRSCPTLLLATHSISHSPPLF